MRYFLLGFVILVVGVVAVVGFRGDKSRKPPIEIWPDMDRQPKLRPEDKNHFFPDGLSSRKPVEGTVSRGSAFESNEFNTGFKPGTTNFVDAIPVVLSAELVERGQQRFNIYCSPCHSTAGDGKGVTSKYGMAATANLHDPRIVKMADGEIFHTITHGKNTMMPYADKLDAQDRWAVIAYVRTLQISRLAAASDVPADVMATLKK
jgi:mono/diheme cytochrome c family protein